MGKVHEIKPPKENQNWFVASDWHYNKLHLPSFNILIQHAITLPKHQRNLIILGDFLEASYMMKKDPEYQHWKDRRDGCDLFFLPNFEEEMKWGNDTLDALQSVFNHIVFVHGNHDQPRFEEYRSKYCPIEYQPHFNVDEKLNLLKRNIGSIPYNDYLKIGQLYLTHGQFHGPSALVKHYMITGANNIVFGHVHKAEQKSFSILGQTRCAWSIPCMSSLNPHWLRGADNDWTNGYGQFWIRPDGNFNFTTHLIFNDILILPNGEVIKG